MIRIHFSDKKEEYRREDSNPMRKDLIRGVRTFHKGFSQYSMTPLHKLDNLAQHFGVGDIYVKDESKRFGLNAFKVLGGSYAIGKYLAEKLQMDIADLDFEYLKSKEVREKIGEITFVTATDGNHGRGVAWAARELGQKCVVYMPKGSSQTRLQNIRNEGAEASIIDGNYNDAVKLSDKMAKEHGWVVIQDTAWKGYEVIPTWIMQGYGTIMDELVEQIEEKPTHVFLQAGVGSFAGAMLGYLLSYYGNDGPSIYIVEPDEANCLYLSSIEGEIRIVDGDMATIMAGLACGEPNTVSWEMLRDHSDGFISCPDYVAARGMRIMAAPLEGDHQIVSGESGAVGLGVVSYFMERNEYKEIRDKMNLDKDSKILIISTEGDTDPEKYREIVWDGTESENND
ncbi:diaminopropionate ammonia-lyase [Gudongella sp. DL1XJH-153]|uniref:diaminopropionate ammonia-lyase n=1 Tax=Gudongella sp. DL1XJH-153 TaxID=3409804 RepID=UPI003BB76A39